MAGMAQGPDTFAQFAYPPGGRHSRRPPGVAVPQQSIGRTAARLRLRDIAAGFDRARPYLTAIAEALGRLDPLHPRVVTAHWIGGPDLARVPPAVFARHLHDRFGVGADAVLAGGRPHHNFHVLVLEPFPGLLQGDERGEALQRMDQCRVRTGVVVAVEPDRAVVRSNRLLWDGAELSLEPVEQRVRWRHSSRPPVPAPEVGSRVALHRDWVSAPISELDQRWINSETRRHLSIAGRSLTTGLLQVG